MSEAALCPEGSTPALIDEQGAPLACVFPDGDPFTLPPLAPPVLDCPPGTVPGWLNENGEPTSCVGDLPNPGGPFPEPLPLEPLPEAEAPAAPIEAAPVEAVAQPAAPVAESAALAETGVDPVLVAVLLATSLGLIASGWTLKRRAVRS